MKITYLHQYFNRLDSAGGTRSLELGKRLVRSGHVVNLVTASDAADRAHDMWEVSETNGIRVHSTPIPYSNKLTYAARIRTFFQFAYRASRRAAGIEADLIYATSTPLTIAIPAIWGAKRRCIPMVFEVRDLWPEAPIQMGALRFPIAVQSARWLEDEAYRRAAHVVALSPGMKDGIVGRGIDPGKVSVIPNSSDLDLFRPDVDGRQPRASLGLQDKFVCLYAGAMGRANGLDYLLGAARVLKQRRQDHIVLVLHGDGSERARLEQEAEAHGLDNVVWSGPCAKAEMPSVVAAADVCLVVFKHIPVLATCSPNKMFDALSAGKPIVVNMPGWMQSLAEDHCAGVHVDPGDAADFAGKLIHLARSPGMIRTMGANARKLAERCFSRDQAAAQLERLLLQCHREHRGARNTARPVRQAAETR